MHDAIESHTVGNVTYRIHVDPDPQSPRDWDDLGTMVCWHRRYNLGDKHSYSDPAEFRESHKGDVILPLYLYDHSGITMRCSPFSCQWDSGQVGYICASRESVLKEYGSKRLTKAIRAKAEACLRSEVETYDDYLTGRVYGYTIENETGDVLDSCWGFYGLDYCREEAKASAESHAEDIAAEHEAELIDCD